MRTRNLAGAAATALAFSLLAGGPALADNGNRNFTVTTTKDTVDKRAGDGKCADQSGQCSLRAAVQEANAAGGGTIELMRNSVHRLTIHGAGEDGAAAGDLDVTSSISVKGDGATVDGQKRDRVFDVRPGASLTLKNITVTGGVAAGALGTDGGGGVRNAGTLDVDGATITRNSAERAGGGIEAQPGSTTTVSRSTLSYNTTGNSPGNGGGLHVTGAGTVHVDRSVISGNAAASEGGGLWNSGSGVMTVDRSTVSGNTASGPAADEGGGGLFQDAGATGTLTVTRAEIIHNVADGAAGSGGGILNDEGTLVVERSTVQSNSAKRAGGGIEANVGRTTLERTDLIGNTTGNHPGNGGGLHLTGAGRITIDRGSVTGNSAAKEGGGLWNSATGSMTVSRTTIRGNTAPVGPDVYQDGAGTGFSIDGRTVPPTSGG